MADQSLSESGYILQELPAQGGNHLSAKAVGNLVSVAGVNSLDDTLDPLFTQKHPPASPL